MTFSKDRSLVGRCGLYCGACVIYRSQRDDPRRQQRLAERFECDIEQVRCNGCGALSPSCWGTDCQLGACLDARGFKYCYECPEYADRSCEKFEKLARGYLEEDGFDLRQSLRLIASGGTDDWLDYCRLRFACRNCGKPTMTGAAECHHCGVSLHQH
ncbi:MAG: DUF3795 domain-containing protein [bacterium]